jgi:hypothetical protein
MLQSTTKKFKDYDRAFTAHQIYLQRATWLVGYAFADRLEAWPHTVNSWSQDFVQKCVYHYSDHVEWQLFRVSLKGLDTYEKLYCLDKYFGMVVNDGATQYIVEKCRIDNYIGALVRGGQLNRKYEVQR